jgi:hypothetical protein
MISRLATVAALAAGTALLFAMPAGAQTGTTGQETIQRGGASPSGSPGTTTRTPRDTTTMGQGGAATTGMGTQGGMQGTAGSMDRQQAAGQGGRMKGGEAAERQMTECLNMAAAQQRPLSTCQQMR